MPQSNPIAESLWAPSASRRRGYRLAPARIIVIGNEKGGAVKSTIATHLATALLHEGASVVVLDLDVRQRSTDRFFANRTP